MILITHNPDVTAAPEGICMLVFNKDITHSITAVEYRTAADFRLEVRQVLEHTEVCFSEVNLNLGQECPHSHRHSSAAP